MATTDQINELYLLTDTTLADTPQIAVSAMIDSVGFYGAVASIWRRKAASYASLVDVSESGSSRSMSQMYKNATAQAQVFQKMQDDADEAAAGIGDKTRARVNSIERV